MIACIPTCNCERETAAHTSGSDGISTIGVGRGSVTGGIVGSSVGALVSVGGIEVAEGVAEAVRGIAVAARVSVGAGEVEGAGTAVPVGGSGVEVASDGVDDPVRPFQSKKKKRRIKRIVTINLKRS
jgi:hypothetical protein